MRARAVRAAVATARELGLDVGEPVVLADLSNVLVHLRPAPVVARVATATAAVRPVTPAADPWGRAPGQRAARSRRGAAVGRLGGHLRGTDRWDLACLSLEAHVFGIGRERAEAAVAAHGAQVDDDALETLIEARALQVALWTGVIVTRRPERQPRLQARLAWLRERSGR